MQDGVWKRTQYIYHIATSFLSLLSLLTYIFGIHHVHAALWFPLVSAAFLALLQHFYNT